MKIKFIDFVLYAVIAAISFDLIFLGPRGLYVYNVSIRPILVIISIFLGVASLISNREKNNSLLIYLFVIIFFFVIWVLAVPMFIQGNVVSALDESRPMIYLGLLFPFYALFSTVRPNIIMRFISASASCMAIFLIASAFSANILGNSYLAEVLKEFYIGSGDNLSDGIYIGPMRDGTYRITVVSYMIFPLLVAYHARIKIDFFPCILFILASFATGTRSFFYVSIFIFLYAIIFSEGRRWFSIFSAAIIFAYFLTNLVYLENYRIFTVGNEFQSDSPRAEQLRYLWIMTKESIVFGNGLGAYSDQIVRSDTALFSYELTYVALLMKIGVLGCLLLILSILRTSRAAFGFQEHRRFIAFILIAFIGVTASNPILFTFHGFYVVSFLLAAAFAFKHNKA